MLKAPSLAQVGDELTVQNHQFFVFNHGNNNGYVIVSADDRALPILGYADEATLTQTLFRQICKNGLKATKQKFVGL